MVTAEDVRRVAGALPRSEEHLIRDHVKFRVGRLVFVSIAPDERSMGFGFPKEERAALVASEPDKFHMPVPSDERYNWVRVWLDAIDQRELEELVVEAWRMVVPKRVAASDLLEDGQLVAHTPVLGQAALRDQQALRQPGRRRRAGPDRRAAGLPGDA